jgi:HD-GYP domain-containing protein (c-di-GMP phosphodiesterase class II)
MDNLARQLGVHDTSNEAVRRSLRLVIHDVRAIQDDAGDLSLVFADGHAFVNGVWIRASKRVWEAGVALTERLESIGWRGIVLDRGAEAAALLRLSQLLHNADITDGEDPGIPNVRLLPIPSAADRARAGEPGAQAKKLFSEGMAVLSRSDLAALDLTMRRRQRALVQGLVQLAEDNPEYLLALTTIRDPTLPAAAHSLMVCIYSIALGRMLDLNRRLLLRLGVCALNHNLGEAMVRSELFHLDRNLLAHERQEVEAHALLGMAHLVEHYGFGERILQRALAAAEHHLHFDGEGGYPYAAPPRHLFSRVIGVADVFDALCSTRPHRSAYPPDQAIKLVWRQAGRQLDPIMVRTLIRLIGRYPPGSLVELDTDELAVVLGPGLGLTPLKRPRVILITDSLRRERPKPELVDLGDRYLKRRAWKRTIVRTRDPDKLGVFPASYLFAPRVDHGSERLDCDDMSLLARADL